MLAKCNWKIGTILNKFIDAAPKMNNHMIILWFINF